MKLLYEAQNIVEAHMLLDLLEQAGLLGRIDGEFLQGGIGELQTMGVVRVMVASDDYTQAKILVEDWEASQPAVDDQKVIIKKQSSFTAWLIGLVVGVSATALFYHTPIDEDGVDFNGDGKLDETWTYTHYKLSNVEADRNFDGDVDLIIEYDRRGFAKSSLNDNDFNGSFETDTLFEFNDVVLQKSDTTGDGFKDYIVRFDYGLVKMIEFINPVTAKPLKVQYFDQFKLVRAEIDTDRDGVLDTVYEYDDIEEVVNTYKK
ncbi:MAG: hypothetical protein ACJAWI_001602 [Marinomonas primoryensis]|jgi:hypothetical protein